MEDIKKRQVQSRNLLSSFFITLLIGLAYQEMVTPVRESIRANGITFPTVALLSIFFMTSIRFFVGNQLHLLSDALTRLPGLLWLYDLVVIITQSVIFVFMAGDSTVEANRGTSIGFYELLITLYSVDVLWIVSQWVLGRLFAKWKREFIPWAWGVLNTVLVAALLFTKYLVDDIYSRPALTILLIINTLAFIIDVILVDYYDAI